MEGNVKVSAEVGVFLAIVVACASVTQEIWPLIGEAPEMALVFVAIMGLVFFMASKDRIEKWLDNLGKNRNEEIGGWISYHDEQSSKRVDEQTQLIYQRIDHNLAEIKKIQTDINEAKKLRDKHDQILSDIWETLCGKKVDKN